MFNMLEIDVASSFKALWIADISDESWDYFKSERIISLIVRSMRALCDQQTKDDKFCGQLTSDKGLKKLFLEFITP